MKLHGKSAVTKLQALFIINVLIVSVAAVLYYNFNSQYTPDNQSPDDGDVPALSEFLLSELTVSASEVKTGTPVTVSVKVDNIGEGPGNFTAVLQINGDAIQAQTVELAVSESKTVQFTVTQTTLGTYSVQIGDLTPKTFTVVAGSSPPPDNPPPNNDGGGQATFSVYSLTINKKEAWPGDDIWITATVKNTGTKAGTYTANLKVNNQVVATKTVDLIGGQSNIIDFTIKQQQTGTYTVDVGGAVGSFDVVPKDTYSLSITTGSKWGVDFKIDGVVHSTPYAGYVTKGTHTIEMPPTDDTGVYVFLQWEDRTKNPTRTINMYSPKQLVATYSGGSSCPSLFIWSGTEYNYVAEVSNHGWLGYIDYINDDGSLVFWRNDPWDYLKLDATQLAVKDGNYELLLSQRWNEIFYLDAAYMMVVDHPSDVDVYSTGVEQYLDPAFMGNIYSVSKNPLTPVSAVNQNGENVLSLISEVDGRFTPGISGLLSPSWDNITWNTLTLDLGDLSGAEQVKLIVNGFVDWGLAEDYNTWLDGFFQESVPGGTQVTPPPFMEVKDSNGDWVSVPESRQFPIPPDTSSRTWIVELTDLFPTDDYSLRINNFWNVTFDYIGVDITSQANMLVQRVNPVANLYQVFNGSSASSGNFTRYGDVTELILSADDEFVIGRQGDEVSLLFSADDIAPLDEGMERDIFLFVACWFKDEYGNWGFGFGFTVDPLPFLSMTGFPYPESESYPYPDHLDYFSEYNTRVIAEP
ncbi:MAG: CARDB domain-containing protein [Candidatus Bathyarchaeia archaeon]